MKTQTLLTIAGCALLAVPLIAGPQVQTREMPVPPIPGYIGKTLTPPPMHIPEGFTPIFNGVDLTGWHVSKTNH
ncbi:MAG TPA: hypothetical protein VG871_00435, partial [Vicinamibacterales bacterium]|nr:hypothetical protein [Vicinamibacterales bacterium]